MFQTSTLLPPFTDREDYTLTLAMFDDDTLEPIDLGGINLQNTGRDFSGNDWQVRVGQLVTASTTQLTIPMFPVGAMNNLLAMELVIPTGLSIEVGDAVQVNDTTFNNSVQGFVIRYNPVTGVLQAQIGWRFEFEVRRMLPRTRRGHYTPWYDFGRATEAPLLRANSANGFLSLSEPNIVSINIPAKIVRTIGARDLWGDGAPGTFLANMVGTDSQNTRQFLFATVPIYAGGVMR